MMSFRRLCEDLSKDGTPWLILKMMLVKMLPCSWIRFRAIQHRFQMNDWTGKGYVFLAVKAEMRIPMLGWRSFAIRQNPEWQHMSLFTVSDASYDWLRGIVAALDDSMCHKNDCEVLEFLNWQPWPIYSTNALVWPQHHWSIEELRCDKITWHSSYTYHVVV